MPRLTIYTTPVLKENEGYKPYMFWTDDERSFVICNAYRSLYLTTEQILPYLQISRAHYYSQWIVPLAVAGLSTKMHLWSQFCTLQRYSPKHANIFRAGLVGAFTMLWLNLSPFYVKKEAAQLETLQTIFNKIGSDITQLNDQFPNSSTSTHFDKLAWKVYQERTSPFVGTLVPEADIAPSIDVLTPDTTETDYRITTL